MNLRPIGAADPLTRALAAAALGVALLALFVSLSGDSSARSGPPTAVAAKAKAKHITLPAASLKPKPYGLLRLTKSKHFPAAVIPKVAKAKAADTVGGATRLNLALHCPKSSVDLGSWCLQTAYYIVPDNEVGQNDFAYAVRACVNLGGYLPSAAQLIGAAQKVPLASTVDDDQNNATTDITPIDGLKDQREMSSTLFTTTAGDSAAGSEGVTSGSLGDPNQGEPNPVPAPADPLPGSLDYVTVYDNHDMGGFAGGEPVGKAEHFRCAFDKVQDKAASEG
jgi:hypothetical protein